MNGEEMFDRLVNRLIQSETRLAQVRQSNKAALARVNELERQIEDDARVRELEKRLSASCDDAAKWQAAAEEHNHTAASLRYTAAEWRRRAETAETDLKALRQPMEEGR